MQRKSACLLMTALILTACSASVNPSDSVPSDNRVLSQSTGPLAGTVEGKTWKAAKAIAQRQQNGEVEIIIAGAEAALTCNNFFPLAPHITFVIPTTTGTYAYDSGTTQGGRLVNMIFPFHTANGGGSDNVLASKSLINIDGIFTSQIAGRVAALSPIGSDHSYDFSGTFLAEICVATHD